MEISWMLHGFYSVRWVLNGCFMVLVDVGWVFNGRLMVLVDAGWKFNGCLMVFSGC